MNNDEDLIRALMGWITLLRIFLGTCCVALGLVIVKTILLAFGIDIGL